MLESPTSVSLFYSFETFRPNFTALSVCIFSYGILFSQDFLLRNTGETQLYTSHFDFARITHPSGGGEGVTPYMGYVGMSAPKDRGFNRFGLIGYRFWPFWS